MQPVEAPPALVSEIWEYFAERLRGIVLERDPAITTEMFEAVLATDTGSILDIEARLAALKSFLSLPEGAALAAANKRIANILKKAGGEEMRPPVAEQLVEPAEKRLFERLLLLEQQVTPAYERREYERALAALAALKEDVDQFFDSVMVMADDPQLRSNRLGLLKSIRDLFMRSADLSRLPG